MVPRVQPLQRNSAAGDVGPRFRGGDKNEGVARWRRPHRTNSTVKYQAPSARWATPTPIVA